MRNRPENRETIARRAAWRRGLVAEHWVCLLFRLVGWRLLGHRWKCRYGEIDLILQRRHRLRFVEVKFSGSRSAASREQALPDSHQQARMRRSAASFLARHDPASRLSVQLDIVLVYPSGRIEILRNAV